MSTYFCETLPDGNSSASWNWKLSSFLSPKATDSFHSHPALKQKTHSLFKNVGYLPFIGCFGWKANGTLALAGPKRNIFEMNRTTMRFTVPSSRLASFDWIFTSAFRPQFTTVPNAPKPAPRLNKDNSVNSILRTASLPSPGCEVWNSF